MIDDKHASPVVSRAWECLRRWGLNALCACAFLISMAWPLCGKAQEIGFRVQSEAQVPLSLAQEADEAIDRAQRWLRTRPPATNDLAQLLLRRYALANPGKPFPLSRCDLTPLNQLMPPALSPNAMTNLTAAIALRHDSPRELFALQRDLPAVAPPPDWRERLVTHLVSTQRIDAQGGHWDTPEETAWAILALRALLNESVPITIP